MDASETILEGNGAQNTMQRCTEMGSVFSASLPTVLVLVPFRLSAALPHWLCTALVDDKITNAITENDVINEPLSTPCSRDTDGNGGRCTSEHPLKQETEKYVPVMQASTFSATSSSNVVQAAPDAERGDGNLQLLRSWVLIPFSCRRSVHERTDEAFLETLLQVAEDKMYLHGFYRRIEREEMIGVQRPSCRKRGRVWEGTQSIRKRSNLGESHLCSGSDMLPFSFVRWSQNASMPGIDVSKLQLDALQTPSILASDERHVLSRYALSSGKLRKECADPYQFITARLHELRHGLEEELASRVMGADPNKKNV